MSVLDQLTLPIVAAPMPSGPGAPELAAAISDAGALGVLPSGYRSAAQFRADLATARGLTSRPLGAHVVVGGGYPVDPERFEAYALRLATEAARLGVRLGQPRFEDDALDDKVAALTEAPVAVVSFTAGLPPERVVEDLHAAGSEVWLTATTPDGAQRAAALGADALILDRSVALTFLDVPVVAAGAITAGADLAGALASGASAAHLAYPRTPDTTTHDAVALIRSLAAEALEALGTATRRLDAAAPAPAHEGTRR